MMTKLHNYMSPHNPTLLFNFDQCDAMHYGDNILYMIYSNIHTEKLCKNDLVNQHTFAKQTQV